MTRLAVGVLLLAACRREPPGPTVEPTCLSTPEICNGTDDDCDGFVDEDAADARVGFADADADGFGGAARTACTDVVDQGGDCDDTDPTVNPAARETADGRDEDCDGTIDDGTSAVDDDGDGWSEDAGDCDDADSTVRPDAIEVEDGRDEDCDGAIDDGTADVDADGWTEAAGDCDDTLATVHPGAEELCGDADLNCDGAIDPAGTAVFVATDGTRTDLSAALAGSRAGLAEVTLEADGTLLLCPGTWYAALTITAEVSLEGRGDPVLSGAARGVPVTSTGPALTVSGFVLEDGAGVIGGCLSHVGGALAIDGVTFTGCTADTAGGGVYAESDRVMVTASTFEDNRVADGDPGGGGMAIVGDTVVITNTTFTRNSVGAGPSYTFAGGLYFQGNILTITDSTFTQNAVDAPFEAGYFGFSGAVHTDAFTTIEGSDFSDNVAGGIGWSGGAGAVGGGFFTIRDSTFTSNSAGGAYGYGGAIVGNQIVAEDTTFAGNTARYAGGAIFTTTPLALTRSEITDNAANTYGGAVYNTASTVLTDSVSTGNSSRAYGYYSTGSCSTTETDDEGGAPNPVSLDGCSTSMTF